MLIILNFHGFNLKRFYTQHNNLLMNRTHDVEIIKLIDGQISHKRNISPYNNFNYNCISVLINLNNIKNRKSINPLFSINKNNIFSWNEKDHGNSKEHPLDWARKKVRKYGGDASGTILLHCFPKILGHVFNPLSVYFCFNRKQKLSALIYEVRNVVGGIHSYVAIIKNPEETHFTYKLFEVSPFLPSEGNYHLRTRLSKKNIKISVNYFIKNKIILNAVQTGKIKSLTVGSLLFGILKGSAFPGKPIIKILTQALKLLIKGAKYKKIFVFNKHKTNLTKRV